MRFSDSSLQTRFLRLVTLLMVVTVWAPRVEAAHAQGGRVDLAVDALGAPVTVVGDPLSFSFTVTNRGPRELAGARVKVTFPAPLGSIPWTCVGSGDSRCAETGVGDVDDLVFLPAGDSVLYRAVQTAGTDLCGRLSAEARVEVPAGVTDPDESDNTATTTRTVLPAAGICATKRLSSGVPEGSTGLSYEIQLVTNLSPGGAALPVSAGGSDQQIGRMPLLSARFTDDLPPGLILRNVLANRGEITARPNGFQWKDRAVGSRELIVLGLEAEISPELSGAEACSQGVFELGKLVSLTDDPAQPGTRDPTCFHRARAIPDIPTLENLALILLGSVLAGLGVFGLRAR